MLETLLIVQDRCELSRPLAVIATDADESETPLRQIFDLMRQCLLNTHDVEIVIVHQIADPLAAVRPGVRAVSGVVIPDIEARDMERVDTSRVCTVLVRL